MRPYVNPHGSKLLVVSGSSKLPSISRLARRPAEPGCTRSSAVGGVNAQPAMIIAAVGASTGKVVIGKAILSAPEGTITGEGTSTAGSVLASWTATPPRPAGCESVTWPVA